VLFVANLEPTIFAQLIFEPLANRWG